MKKPTDKAMAKFLTQWDKAHKNRNIKKMESFLTKKWLNCWWWALAECRSERQRSDYSSALERLLIKEGLIGGRPERPSERAMRLSQKN